LKQFIPHCVGFCETKKLYKQSNEKQQIGGVEKEKIFVKSLLKNNHIPFLEWSLFCRNLKQSTKHIALLSSTSVGEAGYNYRRLRG